MKTSKILLNSPAKEPLLKNLGLYIVALLVCFTMLTGCDKDEENVLTVTPTQIDFGANGGNATISIETDAASWNISNPESGWLKLSNTTGNGKTATVTLSAISRTLTPRSVTLVVTAGGAPPVQIQVSQAASDHLYTVTTDQPDLEFKKTGETKILKITTNAPSWDLNTDADWLVFDKVSGVKGITTVNVTAQDNATGEGRSATIQIIGQDAPPIQIPVYQKASMYPNYNISPADPDPSGMGSNAVQLAAKINLGWNLGNSLEAIGGETAWGNPKTSKALIDLVKQNGFNAVRIPCSWNQYTVSAATAELKKDWLDRVKEVVQYCVDNDMYVLLNIHWDGGWLENNCIPEKKNENNEKQRAFWEQIATHLRDYDERLLFCSANEPNVENAEQMAVLNSYHQTFIDAVRSTGGRNSYRVLVVQGPSTDVERTNDLMNTLPVDPVADRMMVEVHYYTPYQFCLMEEDASWGKMFYYWGEGFHSAADPTRNSTWGEEDTVNDYFAMMKTKFVDNGIPVVMGEYAAARRTSLNGDALALHLASRAYYLKYVTKQAKANGLLPFYWDAGGLGNFGSGIFNRQNNTVFDQLALDALIEGAMQ